MRTLYLSLLLFSCISLTYAQDFYFAQITDTHLGYNNHDSTTEKIVESINKLPFEVKAVIHTGDIFQNNIHSEEVRKEYKRIFDKLNAPFHALPGNHDLLPSRYTEHYYLFKEDIGKINCSFYIDSVLFIMYYSIPLADTNLTDYSEQKQWIKTILEVNKDKKIILCHHQPAINDFYNNKDHKGWNEELNFWWSDLIISYSNIQAIITGHFHRDEMHWYKDTPVYVASSVAGFWGRQSSYRLYHYKDGKLSYNTIYINE